MPEKHQECRQSDKQQNKNKKNQNQNRAFQKKNNSSISEQFIEINQ